MKNGEVRDTATQSLSVGGEFADYANELVACGRYANTSEVLKAAMDALMREECSEEAKAAYLEQALEDGFASGIAEGDVFARVRERADLPPRRG